MATYYVSAAGNDSNDGLSTGTPWLTIAKVNTSAGVGDTVNFNGGDTFSDTSINPKQNQTFQSYGTGKATIHSTASYACLMDDTGLTFTSLDFTGVTYAFRVQNNAPTGTFNSCTFTGTANDGFYAPSCATGTTLAFNSCTFSGSGVRGIYLDVASGTLTATLTNCTVSGNGTQGVYLLDGIDFTATGTAITGNGSYGIQCLSNSFVDLTNCTVASNGAQGVYITASSGSSTIDRLWAYGNTGGQIDLAAGASPTTVTITNGIIVHPAGQAANTAAVRCATGTVTVGSCVIANRTSAATGATYCVRGVSGLVNLTNTAMIRNTSVSDCRLVADVTGGVIDADYNAYRSNTGTPFVHISTSYSFADWVTNNGSDGNSIDSSDLLLTDVSSIESDPLNARPLTASPLVDAGSDYAWSPSTDYEGTTRTGTRDIGAFAVDADIDADFTYSASSGDAPLSVTFTDTSSGGTPDTWAWDFGDGGTSTDQNPTYVFNVAGTYTVALTASNALDSDTETKTSLITVTYDTPWVDLETQLWDYLSADGVYAGLGLKEYRGHLGQFFPIDDIDADTAVTTPDLPAIETSPGGEFGVPEAGSTAGIIGQIVPVCEVQLRLFYGTQRGDHSRADLDAAVNILMKRLNGSDAYRTSMGSGSIRGFQFSPQGLDVIRRDGKPIYWQWTGIVRLEGAPSQV